jgi:RNA polymerase sigma factor (sigma-70 family)
MATQRETVAAEDGLARSAMQHDPPDLSRHPDGRLLALMSGQGAGAQTAREAWAEFYRRHAGYLYAVCLRAYGRLLGGEPGVEGLVSDAFLAVFQRGAATFKPGGSGNPDAARRHVRAWLGQIARRLVLVRLRQRRLQPEDLVDAVGCRVFPSRTAPQPRAGDELVLRVRRAMEAVLTERERDLVATRMQFYDPEETQQRLTPEVLADLAQRWQTTPENLRQSYHRALGKIRKTLESESCGSPDEKT